MTVSVGGRRQLSTNFAEYYGAGHNSLPIADAAESES